MIFGTVIVCSKAYAAKEAVAVGAPCATHGGHKVFVVHTVNEAQVCTKIFSDVVIADAPIPFGVDMIVLHPQAIARSLARLTEAFAQLERIFRTRVNPLNAHGIAVGRTQHRVDAGNAVAVA